MSAPAAGGGVEGSRRHACDREAACVEVGAGGWGAGMSRKLQGGGRHGMARAPSSSLPFRSPQRRIIIMEPTLVTPHL